ncbi:hypothetical protein [Pseudomonas viridiflava]|uniref:hypothetical protein n=1 Tax=Pseudomonas viridiflava TaxID=33069 RepID=UPI000F039D21|nr:hypothetical protein [Pseudomonas viridiflava]
MKKLEFWGAILTVAYLSLVGWWLSVNWGAFVSLRLNELGDFLAGTFGPVAFLWLVLGFLQQGRELKLSTDALKLQAEELRNSVEQQTRMADAAVQQIHSAGQALELQLQGTERAMMADFDVRSVMKTGSMDSVMNKVKITNYRNIAYKVTSEFKGDLPFHSLREHGTISTDQEAELELRFKLPDTSYEGELHILYEDAGGILRIEVFTVLLGEDSRVRFEKLRHRSSRVLRA